MNTLFLTNAHGTHTSLNSVLVSNSETCFNASTSQYSLWPPMRAHPLETKWFFAFAIASNMDSVPPVLHKIAGKPWRLGMSGFEGCFVGDLP